MTNTTTTIDNNTKIYRPGLGQNVLINGESVHLTDVSSERQFITGQIEDHSQKKQKKLTTDDVLVLTRLLTYISHVRIRHVHTETIRIYR